MNRSVAPRRARPDLSQRTYVAPRYQSKLWGRIIFLFFILVLAGIIGVIGGGYYLLHRAQSSSNRLVAVHVVAGDSIQRIAERLQREGVIDNALLFRIDARLQGLGSNLKAGDYQVRRNMSIDGMISALTHYKIGNLIEVTIPEGKRKEEIAAILQAHGINGRQFLQEVMHPDFKLPIMRDKPAGASLEGYLFPNTYKVPAHDSGKAFARFMVQQLNTEFTPAMQQVAARRGYTVYQILTMASIVEREARVASERPTIASVYENRIHIHMKLQADPTVQYALGRPGNWWPVISQDDYRRALQYSTYTNAGLPPGPIANPGLASILAAVYPKHTPYLFFVAKGHGMHAFASTYQQQLINEQKYANVHP